MWSFFPHLCAFVCVCSTCASNDLLSKLWLYVVWSFFLAYWCESRQPALHHCGRLLFANIIFISFSLFMCSALFWWIDQMERHHFIVYLPLSLKVIMCLSMRRTTRFSLDQTLVQKWRNKKNTHMTEDLQYLLVQWDRSTNQAHTFSSEMIKKSSRQERAREIHLSK